MGTPLIAAYTGLHRREHAQNTTTVATTVKQKTERRGHEKKDTKPNNLQTRFDIL